MDSIHILQTVEHVVAKTAKDVIQVVCARRARQDSTVHFVLTNVGLGASMVHVVLTQVHARVWTAFIYGLADKLAQISVKMCVIKRVVCAGVNPDSTQLRVTKTAGVNVLNVPTERHALCAQPENMDKNAI
ncbi:hypothetical protein DPMN_022610 [Dreissena polymorpha]|uniref:Uncharacterized protein n=1 Tax=Dreissena polymorpha TaxID=45954 RepID=A0A9D4SAX6_DREPO|nr:hypothetical protein DPMN_022610 [Dreissena polymorpha]